MAHITNMIVTISAGGAVYTNDGFTGKVTLSYLAILEQVSPNDLGVTIQSRLQTLSDVTLNTVSKTHTITPTTATISGNIIHQFEILENDVFPDELKLVLTARVNSNTGSSIVDTFAFIVNFTGEQPSLTPTGKELALNFDFTKIFELRAGNLEGTIEVGKQADWKEAFNSRQFVMFVKVVDLSNTQTIRLEQFPFVIGTNIFHFQDISFSELPSNVRLEAFVWDANDIVFAPTITHIFNDVDPTTGTNNFLITAIAENGFQIGGTVTDIDFDKLNDPVIGASSVNATVSGEATNLNISATFDSIMAFLISNQVTEPSPECPVGFTLSQAGFCTSPANEPAPPNSTFCVECNFFIPNTGSCPICDPVCENICFCATFKDVTQLCFVLTKPDFDFLIANPICPFIDPTICDSTDIQYSIVNESECCDVAENLSDVLQKINNKIKEVNEGLINNTMVNILPNPFVINDNNTFSGSVKFVATETFNPFFYAKNIVTVLQIKDKQGIVLNQNDFKINNLNFTEIERDEIILYTEFGAFDREELRLEFFVFDNAQDMTPFAEPALVIVTKQGSTEPTNGGGLKFGSGGVLSKVVGGFFGLLTLCLLTEKGRK